MVAWSLYTAPTDKIDATLLKDFIDGQREGNLLTESTTLELKSRRHDHNIARAVAGFANSEGGIILVGISEDNPSFEEAEGVAPSEVVRISDSCRTRLSPLVQPDIVPVALPGRDTVIIVIRVNLDPVVWPVSQGGTVFVRAPGQTVPATRDQIIALAVGTRTQVEDGLHVPALNDAFRPGQVPERDETRDALIRVVGGLWLRPSATDFVFSTHNRGQVRAVLDATPLFRHPALKELRMRRPEARPTCADVAFTSRSATFVTEYTFNTETTRVSATFRKDGFRVAYALDYELRLQPAEARKLEPTLSRSEFATAVLVGLEAAALILPDQIATIAESAPQSLDRTHVWVQNPTRSIDTLLDLRHTDRVSENSMGSLYGWRNPPLTDLNEIETRLRVELERMYLEIGLADAETVAADDVRTALIDWAHVTSEITLH